MDYWAGTVGVFLYGLLNRLLIPLGLHHVVNTFVWFTFGTYNGASGEINRFLQEIQQRVPSLPVSFQ